jgi:tetratricopeptide (TPR) repeat protein
MRLIVLFVVVLSFLGAQQSQPTDRYPEIRAIIREAEVAAKNVPILPDKSRPVLWAGNLYARAGYLDDAERAYSKTDVPPVTVFRARVVYGDLAGAEKYLRSLADPDRRATSTSSLADFLWRTGDTEGARAHYATARQIAARIADPQRRKQVEESIDRELGYTAEPPQNLISAEPHPVKTFDLRNSAIPLFPITTDGFRDLDPQEVSSRAAANAAFMQRLYEKVAAQDRDGLVNMTDSASTPFQRALGMASIEHLAIQANQPQAAEEFAKSMPEANADCGLAKAEALSAAGAAWLRSGDSERAGQDFDAAVMLVKSVKELPLGRVSVVVSIAAAEFKGGMVASSGETFRLASAFARELPAGAEVAHGVLVKSRPGVHYRDEANEIVLRGAIRAHDVGLAQETAEHWETESGNSAVLIVKAWLNAEQPEEAVAFARKVDDTSQRITALLIIAQTLLDRAGAPSF